MPSNPSGTGYRPMPFFVSDGNGGMRLDSAGSLAHLNPQKRFLEQGRPKPVPEHIEHVGRQERVDAYINARGGEAPSYQPNENCRVILPKLASPQQIHTPLYGDTRSSIDAKRSHQLGGLSGSFVGNFLKNVIYKDIDESFEMIQQRKDHLIELKKEKRGLFDKISRKKIEFGQKDKDWIYKPLQDSVELFNNFAISKELPMRFVWRQTWESLTTQKVDLWVIYANSPKAAQQGPDAWMGSRDIVDPRK